MSFVVEQDVAWEALQAENGRLRKRVKEQRNQLRGMNKAIERYERIFGSIVRLDKLYAVEGAVKRLESRICAIDVQLKDLAPDSVKRSWLRRHLWWHPARWGQRWTDKS